MSSIKDRIAAFNKSNTVEVQSTQQQITSNNIRRGSLTGGGTNIGTGTSKSNLNIATGGGGTTSTTPSTTTTTTTTGGSGNINSTTSEEVNEEKRPLSVKERASMIKSQEQQQQQQQMPIRRSSIKDLSQGTSPSPSSPPAESKVQIESSTGLSVKERLAQMNSTPQADPAPPVRRSSIKNIYPPSKNSDNPSSPSAVASPAPIPVLSSTKSSSSTSSGSSFKLPSTPPANTSTSNQNEGLTKVESPSESKISSTASTPSSTSTTTNTNTNTTPSANATTTTTTTTTSTTSESSTSDSPKPSSVKDKIAQMKSNPPPVQNTPTRRSTTNNIGTKPADSPASTTTSTSSPQVNPTPVSRRVTSLDTGFLNKSTEKEPPPGPKTGPEKRVSKLNPGLLGNVNINAFNPGGPRPSFTQPPSALRARSSTTTSTASGELVHVILFFTIFTFLMFFLKKIFFDNLDNFNTSKS